MESISQNRLQNAREHKICRLGQNGAFPWPANPQSRSLLTLDSRESVSAQSERGRKKFAQKPGPPPAQHVAAPGLSELGGFHSTTAIRKSGELEPNSLVTERGVGVGASTPPDFHLGVREYFHPHDAQPCGKILGGEQKILPRCISSRVFSGEREMRSCGPRNFYSQPQDGCTTNGALSIASIFLGLKMLSRALNAAGGRSLGSEAPSSALDRVHFQPSDEVRSSATKSKALHRTSPNITGGRFPPRLPLPSA